MAIFTAATAIIALKVIFTTWVATGSLGTLGLWGTGQFSPNKHWADRVANDEVAYQAKMEWFTARNAGQFIHHPELREVTLQYHMVVRQSGNGTNGTDPIPVPVLGECATDGDCNNNGDCVIEGGVGRCDCDDWYTTEDDDDPCGYRRKGRWGTFMLTFLHNSATFGYLSDGDATYIAVACVIFVIPLFAVIGIYCFAVPGVVIIVGSVSFAIYMVIAAGVHGGIPAYDGNGVKTAASMFF